MSYFAAYLAPYGLTDILRQTIPPVVAEYDRLLITKEAPVFAPWAQNIWMNAQYLRISSIKDAVKQLTAMQRNWVLYPTHCHRRAQLIADQLPHVGKKPFSFPVAAPQTPMGSWTLIDDNTVLASAQCSSPFAHGEPQFIENKIDPPSRAYLKLWEAFSLLRQWPQPGERCLDLGASPGGWTWVLSQLGAHVTAVDRSPLDPKVSSSSLVKFRSGNAFSIQPTDVDPLDWLVCDVICYPEKLYEYVQMWLASGRCHNFVCTLKFQGAEHYGIIEKFAQIPQSRLVHLYNNKHELTWMRVSGN